ncbi:MAG: thioredoxin family protein [Ignavibacteria bacterium]|nr:thioredoxin family protein [Ignavibacteria bacterium]
MSIITKEIIEKAYTYSEYVDLINSLLSENKTTGLNQTSEYIEYTRLNLQRMLRTEKTFQINSDLKDTLNRLERKFIWIVLTEAWCGDAANIVPVLAKIAETTSNITCKFLLRDSNPDIMDKYLTNGKRAIPKLICLDGNTLIELGAWGPRPMILQEKINLLKADPNYSVTELQKEIQLWYFQNKTEEIQKEILENIKKWNSA